MNQENQKREQKESVMGEYIALGMCLGGILGMIIFDNFALGVAMGLALGSGLGAAKDGQNQQDE